MKKQGSILIEVVASIMILTLTTTFIISASIQNTDVLKERILLEEVNRDLYNLTNEFKYNMSKKEIEELLSHEKVGFKYDSDFSKRLLDTSITELERGGDIEVINLGEDSIGLKLKIQANIKIEKSEVNIENEFTKSWWMDEI
ncbi:hypothetical protein psyc5s11_29640 [Clostridium gelidum]|uniref:Type II secretion system protein n=1 Tax=Clostridium gelidum TaxID=704125 RepID=A0ABN6IXP5_9CLOT|nr:hypothetical protein [Clostridium gelidum]BCZ46897.1 hypothetical protein psyc5s11_29640 [Clostridium gelidum]